MTNYQQKRDDLIKLVRIFRAEARKALNELLGESHGK